jgi:FSR family fosmidomycin resistance protein-like MFS transporter
MGGPIGDRIGRKRVIWISILGARRSRWRCPREPVLDGGADGGDRLCDLVRLSAIVVFAQELMPGKVGMIAGIFFGLMFGVSGIGAAAMGISPTSRHRLCTSCAPTCRCWAS